ncbi:MAG: flavodoxin family protein [bacterium]|nr:flavodoxin family protein [bacterium]
MGSSNLSLKKGRFCHIKDDAPGIVEEMKNANALIFATPVYGHVPSAALINFFDRCMYLCHLPQADLISKPTLMVCTAEITGLKETLKFMNFSLRYAGFDIAGSLGVLMPPFYEEGKYRDKMLGKIESTASTFYKAITRKEKKIPTMWDKILFEWNKEETEIYRETYPLTCPLFG